MNQYFQNISDGISTTISGMKLTFRHLWAARKRRKATNIQKSDYFWEKEGMVTLQYPHEKMAIPDNGRYKLHNEIDDCIVCDKCVKICPVDCIEIEPIRATEEIGKASDGSSIRLYAAKFDIDMAKCCYCGLCTTVCPTECLTMTHEFEYSGFDVREMLFKFSNLSPEQAEEKRQLWEQYQLEKVNRQSVMSNEQQIKEDVDSKVQIPVVGKPVFKPKMKPIESPRSVVSVEQEIGESPESKTQSPVVSSPRPVFKPKIRPTDS